MSKIGLTQTSLVYSGLISLTILGLLLLNCNLPGRIVGLFRKPTPTLTYTPSSTPTATLIPITALTSTPAWTPAYTYTLTPTPSKPYPTPTVASTYPTITPGHNQIVSGQDVWTITSIDFPTYISTVAKVFYPSIYRKSLMSYVYLRVNFECTIGKSLLELYTGFDMGLTFVHRPNGYSDVYLQDYQGRRTLVTLMGACWLAAPIPRIHVEDNSFVLYFKNLTPIALNQNPTKPLEQEKIVFVSKFDNDPEIYTVNHDGSGLTRLTERLGADVEPVWSPDRQEIAYVSIRNGNSEVFRMDSSGENAINLTQNPAEDGSPSWSPLGGTIAFHSLRNGNWEIYAMTPDGNNPRNLTRNPYADTNPSWSPDGSKIAFQSDRDGNWEIYIMDANGGNPLRLTDSPAEDRRPSWSPDGHNIAFWSMQDGTWRLYLIDIGTGQVKPITQYMNPGLNPSRPAWSTDGRRIVVALLRDKNLELYIINADGSKPLRLTHNIFDEYDPDW